ncbi:disabled homolog 2-interacting protein-like [Python bivittatus]|uniref:Disabled homolog 2-interacting protein-like n=1 Tax=Python bivittatus TaxID=176946 RepID=A0A9F5J168_PYTBI|nr:disabled homolog 2-interacting protein-like [Python bivittatus]
MWVSDRFRFAFDSPPERTGQRRGMPGGALEKNPSMELAATTPFRVTMGKTPCRMQPERWEGKQSRRSPRKADGSPS